MKARPRRIENRVGEELRNAYGATDTDFERIPVIGRAGPDLRWPNPLDLAIDVKSRLAVPKGLWKPGAHFTNQTIGVCPILELRQAMKGAWPDDDFSSVQVLAWLLHMQEWTEVHGGMPALVLHRPGLNVADALLIFYWTDKAVLQKKLGLLPSGKPRPTLVEDNIE